MFETICVLLKWSLSDNLLLLEAKQNERELSYLFVIIYFVHLFRKWVSLTNSLDQIK
jgi:hypothetical protein